MWLKSTEKIAFLNKLDLLERHGDAISLAGLVIASQGREIGRVVLGSLLAKTFFWDCPVI